MATGSVGRVAKRVLLVLAALLLLAAGGAVALARRTFTKEADVEYGDAGGEKLLLDVYHPVGGATKPRPAIILVHGGGWEAGDRHEYAPMAEELAKEGYVVFSIEYRLVQGAENQWPAPLDDVQRAVRWVRAHARHYVIDPQRIGAIGGSAGGHLVACLGTMETRDNTAPELAACSSRVQCIVDLSGPTDLLDDFAPKAPQGAWTNEIISHLLGGTPAEKPEAARDASPLLHVDQTSAAALIFHGSHDEIVPLDQSQRFADALQNAGVESELVVFPGGHGFADGWSIAKFFVKTILFLRSHLRS